MYSVRPSVRRRPSPAPSGWPVAPACGVEGLESRVLFATFTVTTEADAGPGSLRQAILDANAKSGADTVAFAIPGGGVHTISPATALPAVNVPVTFDGTTQPGYAGSPLIELDGTGAGATANGLTLSGGVATSSSVVRALAVNRFGGNGITLDAQKINLEGCRVGVTPSGDAARPNGGAGVVVRGQTIAIGGPAGAQRNVISGNSGPGLWVVPAPGPVPDPPRNITIQGNVIGTNVDGTAALPNAKEGVFVDRTNNYSVYVVDIGGTTPGAGNLISGNGASGVRTIDAEYVTLRGNLIGTDASGGRPLPNGTSATAAYRDGVTVASRSGLVTIGGETAAARNVVSANVGAGVAVTNGSTTIQGNFIGTDATGNVDLGNGGDGVTLARSDQLFHSATLAGNLISGNGGDGIHSTWVAGEAIGNYIGTNAAGTAAIGNDGDGVETMNSSFRIGSQFSSSFGDAPPVIDPRGAWRNVISGNGGHGVRLGRDTAGAIPGAVYSAYIGTDAAGALALGNGGSGVFVDSGAPLIGGFGQSNLISGNHGDGVTVARPPYTTVAESAVRILSNRIGSSATGGPLGNDGHGVAVLGSNYVWIGGVSAFDGNTIVHNGGAGVWVTGATADQVQIYSNAIFSNALLEIDLGGDGVTPNDAGDADGGPNHLVNFPVVTDVGAVPVSTLPLLSIAHFSLSAEPQRKYRLQFFAAPAADASGHGGATRSLGFAEVTTDAAGNAAGTASLSPVAAGEFVSATATDTLSGRTSEFSAAVAATPSEVYGRYLFYNHSAYDGFGGGADARDDGAIVPGRFPLLGPGTPSFANFTNYSRGLNGVMIDVARLPAGSVLSADDFEFRRGPGDSAATWADAPPSSITARRGAGVGGSDRVTLVWPDAGTAAGAAVANGWLQVTLKATPDTGLSRPDVFYFGNLVGETSTVGPFRVDAADVTEVRRLLYKPQWYGPDPWEDFDKDRRLDARDLAIARANYGRTLGSLTAVPAPAAAAVLGGTPLAARRTALARRRAFALD